MPRVAHKTDKALWRRSRERACTEAGLCAHSARKMQWASRDYKRRGGRYSGPRSRDNSLVAWTRQSWRTHTGASSQGRLRYLPAEAWARLSPRQIARTNAAKRRGTERGAQYVPQPPDVVRAVRGAKR